MSRFSLAAVAFCLVGVSFAIAEEPMDAKVKLPARLITSTELLRMVHDQTALKYAYPTGALVRQIDGTPFNGEATVKDLVAKLAPKVSVKDGVILLQADLPDADLKKLTDQLASDKPDERRVAAYLLGNTKSAAAVACLFAALSDKDESARHHALRSLDRIERDLQSYCPAGRVSIFPLAYDKNANELVEIMKAAPDQATNEWVWAAGIVGRLSRSPNAREQLELGAKHGYERTRKVAEWALGRLEPPAAVKVGLTAAPTTAQLLDQFKAANSAERQADLLLQLGQSGGKDAWDAILKAVDDKDATVRRAAIRALDRCPDPRAVRALVKIMTGPDEPAPASAPEPGSPEAKGTPPSAGTLTAEYRNLAAMSLGRIASPEAVKQLTEYVAGAKKPVSVVALALSWMAEAGRADIAAPLIQCVAVKDEDAHNQQNCMLRSYAYIGLARVGTPEALAAISSKYDEYDNTARYVGHSSIRLAGAWSQSAVDRYVELVRNGKGKISPHGLEMAEDPRAVDALIEAVGKASGDRLCFALQALGRNGDPRSIPALVALLDHKEPWVQYEAMRALRWRWHWTRPDVQAALKRHPIFKSLVGPQPSLKDQPENTWVLRHYPVDFDDYRAVNTSYEAGMTFDESTGKAVKVNAHGQRCDTPQLAETWLYDPKTNTWAETKSPVQPFGMCGTWDLAYDREYRKIVYLEAEGGHHGWQMERARALRGSVPWVYDGQKDAWTPMNPLHMANQQNQPGLRGFGPMVYIDSTLKVFLHGSAWGGNNPKETAGRSWTYDTYSNMWQMLPESPGGPGNSTAHGMCYLRNIDRVLMVQGGKTWLFDPKAEKWSNAEAKDTPKIGLPIVYDPESGTALSFAAESNGTHIWRYDPKANAWSKVNSPVDVSPHHDSVDCVYDPTNNVFIMDGGHVNWNTDHIAVREVWTYKATPGATGLARTFRYSHSSPGIPSDVVASVRRDGSVDVSWTNDSDFGIFDVYAATVEVGTKMHHREVFKKVGEFVKLNKEPVKAKSFADTRKLAEANGLFSHEIRAYYVKELTVSTRSIPEGKVYESGPSATVLTLTSSTPRVSAVEQPDGTTLVKWDANPEKDIRGYAVYRMDEFRTTLAVRLNPVPVVGTQYVDRCESPRAERRRYYVVAVDALNQEGIPSTGAWAFGRP
ncbi:MAG: HEAT repeat domain-containing protein [Phycisphaerae bacterium]|nr:HEAT repeat domain-containing protein [Phycisphaerae bacterium]